MVRTAMRFLLLAIPVPMLAQVAAPRYQSPILAGPSIPALPAPTPITPDGTVVEDVIVRVNDQIIDRGDVLREQQQMLDAVQQGKMAPADFPEAQKDMLRDMIDKQLLLSRGKELDLNVDTDVVRQLDELRKKYHFDVLEQKDCVTPTCTSLEKAVRESGGSYEDFKADMKNQLITQMVVRDEVQRNMHRPTQKEEQAFYDAHKQEMQQPEQVELSEILIPTPADATDAQVAEAKAKADEVAAKLKAGAKFEDLAKQYSGGQTADKGGDLGLFKRGALAKVLEDQTFSLKAGESTPPIRTRQGFVVLKVIKHVPAGAPPMKDVEEQIQEAMYNEGMQPALRKYLTDLREKAYIDIAPGYVDTGASPRETKPVYSAYTPPVPKKKETQKQRLVSPPTVHPATPAAAGAGSPSVAGTTASPAPPASGASTASSPSASAPKKVNASITTKRKKIHREKIRYGQAPRNTLPAGKEETLAAGADQGSGATSNVLPAPGEAMAPISETTNIASNADPLGPPTPERKKTRYSDRAPIEAEKKAEEKTLKLKEKAASAPPPVTAEQTAALKAQQAPLGLSGDTASKKKKKKDKDAPKERLQDQPPAPPAPKPEMTPIPPKSVRDNGEPVVTPPPSTAPSSDRTTLPPANTPAGGAAVDMQPSTPANPTPAPPPSPQPPQ